MSAFVPQNRFHGQPNPFGAPLTRDMLDDIEYRLDFWNRTPQLQMIAWEAAQENISAWGLLALVQMNQASLVDPTHVLVKSNGSPGPDLESGTSLSSFLALEALSGGGKSKTFKKARELVKPCMRPITDGTGQGLLKSIAETDKLSFDEDGNRLKEPVVVTRFHRHTLVVYSPEIKKLNSEFAREGSQTDSMLRSMWSGETTGTTTGDMSRRVSLPDNTYRIHAAWGFQPENAGEIMNGVADGTPQRFLWAPADECRRKTRSPQRRTPPPGVTFSIPTWNVGGNVFGTSGGELPEIIADDTELPDPVWITRKKAPSLDQWVKDTMAELDEIKDREPYARISPQRAAMEAQVRMDSHMVLSTIKQAVFMAWLHGRPEPTDLDFELAQAQMEVSKAVAAGVWDVLAYNEDAASTVAAESRGYEQYKLKSVREALEDSEVGKMAEVVFGILADQPLKLKDLRNKFSTSRRTKLRSAVEVLEAQGRFEMDANGYYWAMHKGSPLPTRMADQFRPRS